jgi:diacylglycerol kinase
MTAAAVFIGAVVSIVVGILIFLPYIAEKFFN